MRLVLVTALALTILFASMLITIRLYPPAQTMTMQIPDSTEDGLPILTVGQGLTVGDVIMAWGDPVGADYGENCTTLFWQDKDIEVVNGPIMPGSEVSLIHYEVAPDDFGHWLGFINQR